MQKYQPNFVPNGPSKRTLRACFTSATVLLFVGASCLNQGNTPSRDTEDSGAPCPGTKYEWQGGNICLPQDPGEANFVLEGLAILVDADRTSPSTSVAATIALRRELPPSSELMSSTALHGISLRGVWLSETPSGLNGFLPLSLAPNTDFAESIAGIHPGDANAIVTVYALSAVATPQDFLTFWNSSSDVRFIRMSGTEASLPYYNAPHPSTPITGFSRILPRP